MLRRKGFTIVELIIVISILGILAVVYLPRFMGATDEAKRAADRSSAATIAKACEMYNVLYNKLPSPKDLCTANLIDKRMLIPKYKVELNKGYYAKMAGSEVSVYYSGTGIDDKSDEWGTGMAEIVYPIQQ